MSAAVPCDKCRYKWNLFDEYPTDGNPCEYCREYDAENEIYSDFKQFAHATNEDRVKNISRMEIDELAALLNELCPQQTTYDWYQWLREEV